MNPKEFVHNTAYILSLTTLHSRSVPLKHKPLFCRYIVKNITRTSHQTKVNCN